MNPLLSAWRAGRTTYGVWCTMPGSGPAELMARQGVDYVCLDYQHGLIDDGSAYPMMQAIEAGGSVPIARIGWNEPDRVMRVADVGARAVIVPMVNTAEEAARAARALRYPPHGNRSFGPVRAREVLGTDDLDALAEQACLVMIETAEGIRNVREIAATPGVHGLYIGPSDLAISMGLRPGHTPLDPGFVEVIEGIRAACKDNGIAAGIHCTDGDTAGRYAESGFDMVTVGADAPMLTAAVRAHLAAAKNR